MNKKLARKISLFFIICALLLVLYNVLETRRAYVYSKNLIEEINKLENEKKPLPIEEDILPIPSIEVDGVEIIGNIEIPKLNVNLPVTKDWNYDLMKKYPNRYIGDTYNEPLIIMAHNYINHFGKIYELEKDDNIVFTDALGRVTKYKVELKDVIDGKDIDSMVNTDYDLTLFTCTLDSASRVTIRASRYDY